ncbi:MAG: PRC-barrel domain-containing protein [Caldilineaceae bacterium]
MSTTEKTVQRTRPNSAMSLRVDKLMGATIRTSDDQEIGSIVDFLFDDQSWQTRYLVVETGPWLFGRKVLVSTVAIDQPLSPGGMVSVRLTKKLVENSPEIDTDEPVSMQQQKALHDYYQWPYYWAAAPAAMGYGATGVAVTAPEATVIPAPMATDAPDAVKEKVAYGEKADELGDPNLRSMKEVIGYHIRATNDEIGHVEDFFVDSADLMIRFMLVDTRNWLPGRHVLVSPAWIDRVSWHDSMVYVNVSREQIEASPEYSPVKPVTRDMERELFTHYGYPYRMV